MSPQAAAKKFAFSSVFILLLYCLTDLRSRILMAVSWPATRLHTRTELNILGDYSPAAMSSVNIIRIRLAIRTRIRVRIRSTPTVLPYVRAVQRKKIFSFYFKFFFTNLNFKNCEQLILSNYKIIGSGSD